MEVSIFLLILALCSLASPPQKAIVRMTIRRKPCALQEHDYVKLVDQDEPGPSSAKKPKVLDAQTSASGRSDLMRCPKDPPPNAVRPVRTGARISDQSRRVIKNVKMYLHKICTNSRTATAAAANVDEDTITNIMRDMRGPEVNAGRRGKAPAQVDEFDKSVIRRIVHQEYFAKKKAPTLDKMLKTVKEQLIDENGHTTFPYSRTVLYKILLQLGFKYRKQKGPDPYALYARANIVDWRSRYLRQIRKYRDEGRPVVYLDETWYDCNDAPSRSWIDTQTLSDPYRSRKAGSSLTLGKLPTSSGRGQRLIIVNAITREGPVPNALLVLRSRSSVTPADYHKDMDSHNFEKWMREQLLPKIPDNAAIIMDNAPYHSRHVQKLPLRGRRDEVIDNLKKLNFFQFLASKGIPSDPNVMTMTEIFALCRMFKSHVDKFAVEEMITANGRDQKILCLPPYHCILNPIEMLWSYQKNILRSENTQKKVSEAEAACRTAFAKIPDKDLTNYFQHIELEEEKFWKLDGLEHYREHPPVIIDFDDDSDSEERQDASTDNIPNSASTTMPLYGLEESDEDSDSEEEY